MKASFCSTCGQDFSKGEQSISCRLCLHGYHPQCWGKTGGCTTVGCEGRAAASEGVSAESLNYTRCPNCKDKVLHFAVKCRYCRCSLNEKGSTAELNSTLKSDVKGKVAGRKDPILTFLLNLIFPGAGYIYLGNMFKGVLWCVLACLSLLVARPLGVIAIMIWIMYDSTRQALRYNAAIKNRSL